MNSQSTQLSEKRFAQWFCVFFVSLGVLVFVFKRTDLFPWIGQCNPAGYSADHYLAYCHTTRYGDYEHYAMYNATEPQAIEALSHADVLFLGNSNTQYAFSTEAVVDYFDRIGIPHYVMGFGQGAQSPVALSVIEKHALQPQVMVANIDPFFSTQTNGTFQRVLDGGEALDTEFVRKQKIQQWQARVCANANSRWSRWACRGHADTLFRSRKNGHWLTDYYRENLQHPVTESDNLLDTVDAATVAANEFIERVNIRRKCVILTVTPRTSTPIAFAKKLASSLQLPLVLPELDNLVTIDHSHLDKQSAERWSTAFIELFDHYANLCLSGRDHVAESAE